MAHNPHALQVVQRALALSVDVHRLADRCHESMARVSPGMRNQLLRAVNSIALNLAEGAGYQSPSRTASFCTTAIGSCNEVELQLRLARALNAIPDDYDVLIDEVVEIRKMSYGFRKHVLGRRDKAAPP
ncbi:four helix bundle protein [Gemmatimonas sp.]|uniref:four helix bundle protein n=1 Tax=Gemmatimonas sp. TaxID=1962908 RepID=UPI0037BFEA77